MTLTYETDDSWEDSAWEQLAAAASRARSEYLRTRISGKMVDAVRARDNYLRVLRALGESLDKEMNS